MSEPFRAEPHLARLKDFQRATVRHVVDRMYEADDFTRRFLVADETGLGKSVVARGVIAECIERLLDDDSVDRIDIIYVCSNLDIAAQNLNRLNVLDSERLEFHTRLTMLVAEGHALDRADRTYGKPINLIAFTPGTSLNQGSARGHARERAVLYLLLKPVVEAHGLRERALFHALRGTVMPENFQWRIDQYQPGASDFDPTIVNEFAAEIDASGLLSEVEALLADIGYTRNLPRDLSSRAKELTSRLRRQLARASLEALEPDLVILDEFQRFRELLDLKTGGEAAELAHELFEWGAARTLLLSATPYKPFTTASEDEGEENHYDNFLTTLRFLSTDDEHWLDEVKTGLASFRDRLVSGKDAQPAAQRLRELLLKYMCRTERPQLDGATREIATTAQAIVAQDFRDFAHLRDLARNLDAPVEIEYWKSAPYFINFLDGYKVGERLKDALRSDIDVPALHAAVAGIAKLAKDGIEAFALVDLGNARLRELAERTVASGWEQLLWMPPSLPYLPPGGIYAESWTAEVTKQLIFSSWTATPTAIAGLLSYEADRRLAARSSRLSSNTAEARDRRATLLEYRVEDGRPAGMPTLALFWPHPALARLTDPLRYARESSNVIEPERWAADQLRLASRGAIADTTATRTALDVFGWPGSIPRELRTVGAARLAELISGSVPDEDEGPQHRPTRLDLHVAEALSATTTPAVSDELARLAMHSPANIAWRALGRLIGPNDDVTEAGHWQAAAQLGNGLRSLFNRLESNLLFDALYRELPHWQAVLAYSRDGNLQAVMDEYLHHVRSEFGKDRLDNAALRQLAARAGESLSLRPSRYRAFDPDRPDEPIALMSRFALRYGSGRAGETDGDDQAVRKAQVRSAFNSPFWPFVLATTSAGQEGIDFHWWCHSVVHWNTPTNPVDFEQREGRVNRFGGHAVRRNIAAAHRDEILSRNDADVWKAAYDAASGSHPELGDFSPYWVYPGPYAVERHLMPYPLSRDEPRANLLKRDLAIYRLALGQPRQEDLLSVIRHDGSGPRTSIDLAPPRPDQ